ncbi:hypothetical protein TCE0_018f05276 [Talaromyces pinophilus]|uniref:Uncharacterized protein n=1 Tax=Talaromyces pinophilus TaxID=128442 RepID=A0A510NVQ0_TALPI|nr:hypothetical protein TCE0_018f05276 [Talaromyces pinophilus]
MPILISDFGKTPQNTKIQLVAALHAVNLVSDPIKGAILVLYMKWDCEHADGWISLRRTAAWARTMYAVEKNITRRRPDLSATKMMVRLPRARHICKQAEKMPEYVPSEMVASSNYSLLLTIHRDDSGRMVGDGEKDEDEDEDALQGHELETWNVPNFTQDASAHRNFSAFC